MAVLQYTKL
ncbi:rCG55138, partial [Rattus norvegicus]